MKKTEYTQEFLNQVLNEAIAPNAIIRQVGLKHNFPLNTLYEMVRKWRSENEPQSIQPPKRNKTANKPKSEELEKLRNQVTELSKENARLTNQVKELKDLLTTAEILVGRNLIQMKRAS